MLKAKVGYSTSDDSYQTGVETAKKAVKDMSNPKLAFLYTSVKNDIKSVIKGVKSVINVPTIGCTSSGGIIVEDGSITSDNGFAGMML